MEAGLSTGGALSQSLPWSGAFGGRQTHLSGSGGELELWESGRAETCWRARKRRGPEWAGLGMGLCVGWLPPLVPGTQYSGML